LSNQVKSLKKIVAPWHLVVNYQNGFLRDFVIKMPRWLATMAIQNNVITVLVKVDCFNCLFW